MPLTLIEGQFRILQAAPDGDSIRFYPNDPHAWDLVTGSAKVRANKQGGAQLRLDAIDTLETHYQPQQSHLGMLHQPRDLAEGAATALLSFLGFKDVKRDSREVVTAASPDKIDGYILTRFADKYGRCVAFAGKGNHAKKTGAQIQFDIEDLRKTANYFMVKDGWAYPTYYSKLYPDIRRDLTGAVHAARSEKRGIWAKDLTGSGLTVHSLDDLGKHAYVMPKLFRRLADYLALGDGDVSLDGFIPYLAGRDDRLYILSDQHITGFDYVVQVNGQKVSLTKDPEDLVFQEG